jgi:hypothetical protein
MAEPYFSEIREFEWSGGIYVLRDIMHANGRPSGKCQYAIKEASGDVRWYPCVAGVLTADIKPLVRLDG